MKRNTFIWLLPVVVVLLLAAWLLFKPKSLSHRQGKSGLDASSETFPHIVLIIVDALRADKLGCYGFKGDISPEIDALAKESVLFEDVITQCSWTRPSVASMLTGLYPRSVGIYKEKYDILPDKYLTLAEILKSNGYQTFGITANPNINKFFNFHQGFDDYQDSGVIWKWMKAEPGKKKADDNTSLPGSKEIFTEVLKKAASLKRGPVYIQINIMDVHSPYLIRDEYKDEFNDYPVKKANTNYSTEKLTGLVRGTLAAVKQVSLDIGEFVNNLQAIPNWENTLFVITSDHGQGLDDHPDVAVSQGHGHLLYGSQLQVPLIFYHPGKSKKMLEPHRVQQRVRLIDLMPTLLDYIGISLPESQEIHGTSLCNLLTRQGEEPELPDFFIAETNLRKVNKIAVYSSNWKYFENRDQGQGVNPRELHSVGITENGKLTDKIHKEKEVGKKMKRLLYQWEKKYKRANRTFPQGQLSEKEIQQLKSLGYLN